MTTYIGETVYSTIATKLGQIGDASITTWGQTKRPKVFRSKFHDKALATSPCIVMTVQESWTRATATPHYDVNATIIIRLHFDAQTWAPSTDLSTWKHDLVKSVRDHTVVDEVNDLSITGLNESTPEPDGDMTCKLVMTMSCTFRVYQLNPAVHIA